MKTFEYISQIKRSTVTEEKVRLNIRIATQGTDGTVFSSSHITIEQSGKEYIVEYFCKLTGELKKVRTYTRFKLLKQEYAR